MAGRRQQDYDYLVKLLLIGDSGGYLQDVAIDLVDPFEWCGCCLKVGFPTVVASHLFNFGTKVS